MALAAPAIFLAAAHAHAAANGMLGPGSHTVDLKYEGLDRSYVVHVPPGDSNGKRFPAILNFHGAGSNAEQEERYSGMDATADRAGFVAVYPNGTGRGTRRLTWNAGGCCAYAQRKKVDDVGFTRALIDDLASRVLIDQSRVYATGISNGGMMAFRLGVETPDRIAAIAPVEGALMVEVKTLRRPMPLMLFNSVDDRYVPYTGRFGRLGRISHVTPYPAVDEEIARWRGLDGCPAEAKVSPALKGPPGSADANKSATRYEWGPCARGTRIVLWKLAGSGHVWPGTARSVQWLGPATTLINANDQMWQFFRDFAVAKP